LAKASTEKPEFAASCGKVTLAAVFGGADRVGAGRRGLGRQQRAPAAGDVHVHLDRSERHGGPRADMDGRHHQIGETSVGHRCREGDGPGIFRLGRHAEGRRAGAGEEIDLGVTLVVGHGHRRRQRRTGGGLVGKGRDDGEIDGR